MSSHQYDLAIIGSGPGGQKAAVTAARLGKRVAVIDKESMFGGVCLRTGGIPSKALREAVLYLTGFRQRTFYGRDHAVKHQIVGKDLKIRMEEVVKNAVSAARLQMRRNKVGFLAGYAKFVDPHTLEIETEDGSKRVTADYILIACGTRPAHSPKVPVDGNRILDTNQLLDSSLEGELAQVVTVVGAGVIGLEYASMSAALGMKTTVVDEKEEILPFVDREITETLIHYLRSEQVVFRLGEKMASVTINEDNRVKTSLESGKTINSEKMLYAVARQPNTDSLYLEAIGLLVDHRGRIKVNENFQTSIPNVYAAGDVIGFPSLASTSMEQGRAASHHMFGLPFTYNPDLLPYGIYTIPEISMVGETEQTLTANKVPYEIGIARFEDLAKGQLIGDTTGLLKLIFDPNTLKLLGVHTIGEGAAEIIHIGQMAMLFGATVEFLRDSVFNFPTMAEAYKMAADDGLSKL